MRKLAHIRALGYGLRIWDSPVYITPGLSLSQSIYDTLIPAPDDYADNTRIRQGIYTEHQRAPIKEQTATRMPRVSAQFSSLAQAASWQGGWQTSWSHLTARPNLGETRTLTQNNNRNAYGRAEQQRATVYNAWPSAGAIFPKAI